MDPEPGEEIFFCGHPSWRALASLYVKGMIVALVAGVIAGVATRIDSGRVQVGWVVVAVLAVFALLVALGQLRRIQTTYSITSRRLAIETGVLSRELLQTRLERVQNVSCRQSLAQRMIGIGTVDFDTAAEAGSDFAFRGVGDPRGIVRTVDRAQHELGVYGAPLAPRSPADV